MSKLTSILVAGACLLSAIGCVLTVDRDAIDGARIIGAVEAASSEGGYLSLQPQEPGTPEPHESEWFAECVGGKNCVGMGNENNGFDCSSYTYIHPGQPAPQRCRSKPCVYSCPGSFIGGLCEFAWFDSCTDTTLTGSPGLCGRGEKGHCSFSSSGDPNTIVTHCTSLGLCYGGDGGLDCGVARTCQ